MAYVPPGLFEAMHEITKREGTTIQAAVEELCATYVRYGGEIPIDPTDGLDELTTKGLARAFFGRDIPGPKND